MSSTKRPTGLLLLLLVIMIVAILSMAVAFFLTQTGLMENFMLGVFDRAAQQASEE